MNAEMAKFLQIALHLVKKQNNNCSVKCTSVVPCLETVIIFSQVTEYEDHHYQFKNWIEDTNNKMLNM